MSSSGFLGYLVNLLASQGLTYLVYTVGFAFALARWRYHPRASLLASLALALMLVHSVFFTLLYYALPQWLHDNHIEIGWAFSILGILRGVTYSVLLGLLILAVFVDRRPAQSRTPPYRSGGPPEERTPDAPSRDLPPDAIRR